MKHFINAWINTKSDTENLSFFKTIIIKNFTNRFVNKINNRLLLIRFNIYKAVAFIKHLTRKSSKPYTDYIFFNSNTQRKFIMIIYINEYFLSASWSLIRNMFIFTYFHDNPLFNHFICNDRNSSPRQFKSSSNIYSWSRSPLFQYF